MSLICETIVSEEESRDNNEEELDFEEEIREEDKDEGELDDDEDLEEGEVKEDEEEDHKITQRPEAPQNPRQNSICRFYGRGQCTWGNNCRFVHPSGGMPPMKRLPPPPPVPPPMQPPMMRQRREYVENESAWERGLKQAKEMIVRAHRRKEEEIDFEDKRFNLSVDESRDSSPERPYDEEYERRRRLAFESAPWNNDEPQPQQQIRQNPRNPETYRDPWRRSKTPPGAPKQRRPPVPGSRSGSKRSHSMSSISASASDSSDFSGSEASESFSESSGSNISGSGGRSGGQRRRFNRKTVEKKTNISSEDLKRFPKKNVSNNRNILEKNENYDSWSESLSDSESISSYYSSGESSGDPEDGKRIPKRPPKDLKRELKRSEGPPLKKPKPNQRTSPPKSQTSEAPKKSPIKMTFMKKKQNLKKEVFNSSQNPFNGRINETIDEELAEEEISLSPKAAKSLSSASPLSGGEGGSPVPSPGTNSRREELLQQLKAVEDAIARKRSKIN